MSDQDKDALLAEAKELGLNVPGNIGIPKLKERIAEAKAEAEADVQGQTDQDEPEKPEDAPEAQNAPDQPEAPEVEPTAGPSFVYLGPLDETECYGTKFVKGEASIVTSELGIKKLSKHPHFEKQ